MGEQMNLGFVPDCGDKSGQDGTKKGETKLAEETEVGLQRNLGLFSGVSLIVGNIVSATKSPHVKVSI